MTENNVLLVTVDGDVSPYERGLEAIRSLRDGEPVDDPATVTFADEAQLGDVFDERAYTLLRVIREEQPESIRGAARLIDRDVKNVHEELTTLEALGVIRFDDDGRAKRPVFPYDDLVIAPFGRDTDDSEDATTAAP